MNRRKPHTIKIEEESYQKHLKKIEQMMSNPSPAQKNTKKVQRKITKLLSNSRHIHSHSKTKNSASEQKPPHQSRILTHRQTNSVVKRQFSGFPIKIPGKHSDKLHQKFIDKENGRLHQRLLQTKSHVLNSTTLTPQNSHRKIFPPIYQSKEMSKMFEEAQESFNDLRRQKFFLRSMAKKNTKLVIGFPDESLLRVLKEKQNSLFVLEFSYANHKTKTSAKPLWQLLSGDFVLSLNYPQNSEKFLRLRLLKAEETKKQYLQKGHLDIDLSRAGIQGLVQNISKKTDFSNDVMRESKKLGEVRLNIQTKLSKKNAQTLRNSINQQQNLIQERMNLTEHAESPRPILSGAEDASVAPKHQP